MPLFEVAKKVPFRNLIQNMSQALSKWIKVDKWNYLKNPSYKLKKYFCLGFLWIPRQTGKQNWRGAIFLRFNLIEYQCVARRTSLDCFDEKFINAVCVRGCPKKTSPGLEGLFNFHVQEAEMLWSYLCDIYNFSNNLKRQ